MGPHSRMFMAFALVDSALMAAFAILCQLEKGWWEMGAWFLRTLRAGLPWILLAVIVGATVLAIWGKS